jgi:adenylate cyclase
MADLRGFSLLGKDKTPATIVSLLNNYLAVMFEVVEAYGGTIDDVSGDSILVLFGAPLTREDHCDAAIACALSMQLAMVRVNGANRDQGLPLLEMGIGLCTGEVIAGTIGSSLRAKYGVVGAAVNLAARIEELTVGGEVLAAESTVTGSGSSLRIDADYCVEVKGSADPLLISSIGAIAGGHDLALPIPGSTRFQLSDPIAIQYCLMNGKHREGLPSPADVTDLAEREAWIVAKQGGLAPFTNLALSFPGIGEDAYAKVRETSHGRIHIVFTAMSGELRTMISSLCRL